MTQDGGGENRKPLRRTEETYGAYFTGSCMVDSLLTDQVRVSVYLYDKRIGKHGVYAGCYDRCWKYNLVIGIEGLGKTISDINT